MYVIVSYQSSRYVQAVIMGSLASVDVQVDAGVSLFSIIRAVKFLSVSKGFVFLNTVWYVLKLTLK